MRLTVCVIRTYKFLSIREPLARGSEPPTLCYRRNIIPQYFRQDILILKILFQFSICPFHFTQSPKAKKVDGNVGNEIGRRQQKRDKRAARMGLKWGKCDGAGVILYLKFDIFNCIPTVILDLDVDGYCPYIQSASVRQSRINITPSTRM
jgi:hypothetical protein